MAAEHRLRLGSAPPMELAQKTPPTDYPRGRVHVRSVPAIQTVVFFAGLIAAILPPEARLLSLRFNPFATADLNLLHLAQTKLHAIGSPPACLGCRS
jgi:hypothetical protein